MQHSWIGFLFFPIWIAIILIIWQKKIMEVWSSKPMLIFFDSMSMSKNHCTQFVPLLPNQRLRMSSWSSIPSVPPTPVVTQC